MGKIKLFPTAEYSSKQPSDPVSLLLEAAQPARASSSHRRAERPVAEEKAAQDLRAGDSGALQLPLRLLPQAKESNVPHALRSVLHWKEKPMGAALSFLGEKLFASSTLINARCENISRCTSVAAVQPPIVRRTGGFLKKRMTTIYVDSRKSSDSDFEVDLGESLHLQSDARLAVYKIRIADSFLLTDRGYCVAELGALHGLPTGRLDQLQLRYCYL